jgi:hypothetical protein
MSSPSPASLFVRSSVKSAIKALSSLTVRDSASNDRDGVDLHGVEEIAVESLLGRVGREPISRPEDLFHLTSELAEPEVRLAPTESPSLETAGQSKMDKIRSLYGDDFGERDGELSSFQERRYDGNPEVRPNLVVNSTGSLITSFSRDNLPVPPRLGPRFGWNLPGGDGERNGRDPREMTRNDDVYFSNQVSQRPLPFSYPRDTTVMASEMGQSVRFGREDIQNVTQLDSKRHKERAKDRAYRKRFSLGSSAPSHGTPNSVPVGGHSWPREESYTPPVPRPVLAFSQNTNQTHSQGLNPDRGRSSAQGPSSPVSDQGGSSDNSEFEITFIYEGMTVRCTVWASMSIQALHEEAARIFHMDVTEAILVLFCSVPVTLRTGLLSGPPRISPGATILVFRVPGLSTQAHHPGAVSQTYRMAPTPEIPALSSKLLSTFKLPKFDGVSRSWKLWEKAFQRFLGLHQLDYVLEEDFPEMLWVVPGAKAANKMVFFLIEDAVAAGTLASKLVRQATKWNGHEALVLLRNGYVFNGPQTATILLSEISRIRLLRDEDASSFCLRLVELIEDLELIPGDAAVFLTDTQKLGYLLSAIRHESGLQAVYSQLLSEQLRGTVTFEQACRELHHRVEAMKADDFMDGKIRSCTGLNRGEKEWTRRRSSCESVVSC